MSNILKYQNSSSPLLNPHKIIENIPAREWGPRKINEDYSITEGKGTNFWRAPFQYLGNKGLGVQNEKLARDLISEFDQMRSENPDYNYTLDKNYQSYDDAINYINHLEGLKKYLHLPYDTGLLMESKYKPTRLQGTNEKTYKFRSSMTPGYWNDVVDDMIFGEHSKNQYYDQSLNEFTAYRDRDEKGDFVSIYDEWDYNPAVRGGNKKWNKLIDTLTGGTPFVIYDRVYLDDYYDIPEEARGNPFITPAVVTAEAKKFGGIIKAQNSAKLISKVNQSNANFVKRLLDPNRKSIPDWETKGQKIATHKMSWGEDEHGAYVFPEVQEVDGQLIDFSRPPYVSGIADYMAHKNNNIIRMSPEEADWFTRNYKQYYPSFKKGGRIHIKKKNRGSFTRWCKGKVTEECIRRGKNSPNPAIRKKAVFAANARRWKHENGGVLKAQEGTGNLHTPHPLSPVGIALNQAKAMSKGKKDQQHLPPGVKEVVGPDGKKVAIRIEQPLVPLEQSIAEWLPGTGDVAEVGYITDDVKNGRYGSAALTAAMVALPGNVGKILRKSDIPASKSTKVVVEESKPRWANTSQSKLSESERLGIPKGERNQPGKPRNPRAVEYDVADGRPTKEFLDDYHAYAEALKTGGRHVDITDMFDSSWYRQRLLNQGLTEEQADQLILRLKDRVSPENLVIVDGLNSVRNFRRIEDGIPVEMTPERLTFFGRHTTGPGLFGKSLIELSTKADPEEIILHEIGGHRSQPLVADFKNIYLDQALTNLGLQRHMKIGKTADYGLNWGEVRARALTIAKQMSDAGWNPNSPEQVNVWLNKHIFTNSPKNANQGALYYDRPRFIKAVSEGLKNGGKL